MKKGGTLEAVLTRMKLIAKESEMKKYCCKFYQDDSRFSYFAKYSRCR
jgi:hypothetical protein